MQESDLQRASKILRTEFGSDWKQIVQTLGTRELTHCVGQDLTSFMAFPERAEGGSNQWRGNCSPQVVAKLIQFVKKCRRYEKNKDFLFLDPMSGSGTSQDVAEELHIPSVLYDLNPHPPKGIGNWNALKDEVAHSADLIFFHPPYHDIIRYSGNMWGRPHEDDLSRCENYEDYIEKLNYVIKKLYFSLRQNGYLAILVGDIRQKGIFHSIAADMLHSIEKKIQNAITLLKMFEAKAIEMHPEGYYLCFSGGKDSQVIYELAKQAKVKFQAYYNVTTVDPPELVYFIRKMYPAVIINQPDTTMWELISQKHYPPTRRMRYCCSELKERGGKGRFVVTGVRWAESRKRRKRGFAEIQGPSEPKVILNSDNDEKRRQIENCQIKGKRVLNPVLDWTDDEVWQFIHTHIRSNS